MNSEPVVVSIIIAVKDAAGTLERALRSAFGQTHGPVEVVVIDGASTDGTREIIERHANRLTFWRSEPDSGIGEAWNKGIACSTGDVIILLNADDELRPDFASRAAGALTRGVPMIAYGDTLLLDEDGRTVMHWRGQFDPSRLHRGFGFWHTSCAITRSGQRGPLSGAVPQSRAHGDWISHHRTPSTARTTFRCRRHSTGLPMRACAVPQQELPRGVRSQS